MTIVRTSLVVARDHWKTRQRKFLCYVYPASSRWSIHPFYLGTKMCLQTWQDVGSFSPSNLCIWKAQTSCEIPFFLSTTGNLWMTYASTVCTCLSRRCPSNDHAREEIDTHNVKRGNGSLRKPDMNINFHAKRVNIPPASRILSSGRPP